MRYEIAQDGTIWDVIVPQRNDKVYPQKTNLTTARLESYPMTYSLRHIPLHVCTVTGTIKHIGNAEAYSVEYALATSRTMGGGTIPQDLPLRVSRL